MSDQMRQRDNLATIANHPPPAAEIRHDPFAYLFHEHVIEERLCDLLEASADALADGVSPDCGKTAVDYLQSRFPRHIALENEIVFPMLKAARVADLSLGRAIKQALQEHAADEDTAAELAEALTAFMDRGKVGDANALGYMLRGFFEQRRRHIVWEEALLYPLARGNIAAADMDGLGESILRYLMHSNRVLQLSG